MMPRRNRVSARRIRRPGGRSGHRFPRCRASSKIRYRDRPTAEGRLRVIRSLRPPGHSECRAYRCPDCKGWHLTSWPVPPHLFAAARRARQTRPTEPHVADGVAA